jgi:hypothetical protein
MAPEYWIIVVCTVIITKLVEANFEELKKLELQLVVTKLDPWFKQVFVDLYDACYKVKGILYLILGGIIVHENFQIRPVEETILIISFFFIVAYIHLNMQITIEWIFNFIRWLIDKIKDMF